MYYATVFWCRIHSAEPHLLLCRFRRVVCPLPFRYPLWEPSCHPYWYLGLKNPSGPCPCRGWPPSSLIRIAAPPSPCPLKRSRKPAAPPPPCWRCATSSSKSPLTGEKYSPLLASRHLPPRSPVPGIWRSSPSPGGAHRGWNTCWWIPYPLPPIIAIYSAPRPGCTVLCVCASHSGPSTAPAFHTACTVGGGGFPNTGSPLCPWFYSARSAPPSPCASTPGHYTLRIGRA